MQDARIQNAEMQYARIQDGIVVEIIAPRIENGVEIPIEQRFSPTIVAQLVPDPDNEAVIGGTWDGTSFGPVPRIPKEDQLKILSDRIDMFCTLKITEGIRWRASDSAEYFDIRLTDNMQTFLRDMTILLTVGNRDPHNGFIRSGGLQTDINEDGLTQLCQFAGMWSYEMLRIAITEKNALAALPDEDLFDRDINAPDMTDWTVVWQDKPGWDDNRLTHDVS